MAELDHVKQTYHFAGLAGIDGKFITVDVYAIPCEVMTQSQLTYFRVMVSFLEHCSEAYGFVTSNCSDSITLLSNSSSEMKLKSLLVF